MRRWRLPDLRHARMLPLRLCDDGQEPCLTIHRSYGACPGRASAQPWVASEEPRPKGPHGVLVSREIVLRESYAGSRVSLRSRKSARCPRPGHGRPPDRHFCPNEANGRKLAPLPARHRRSALRRLSPRGRFSSPSCLAGSWVSCPRMRAPSNHRRSGGAESLDETGAVVTGFRLWIPDQVWDLIRVARPERHRIIARRRCNVTNWVRGLLRKKSLPEPPHPSRSWATPRCPLPRGSRGGFSPRWKLMAGGS